MNAKNTYNINFPEEMLRRLKSICNLNQNEDLTKQFNDRANKLLADKNMIFIYSIQLNFADLISKTIEDNKEPRLLEMIKLFYSVLHLEDKVEMIINQQFEELKAFNETEESWREIRSKVEELADIDTIDYNINSYINVFRTLDEEYLRNINDFSSCLYIYLGKMIEFNIEKINHRQLKEKLDHFFEQITITSNMWPTQKLYYESTVSFIENTKALTGIPKKLYNFMERYEIENPMNDFHLEKIDISRFEYDQKLLYSKIIENRKILSEKINRLEEMAKFYCKCISDSDIEDDQKEEDYLINVGGQCFLLIDFLFIISLIKPKMEINKETFKITYKLIKQFLPYSYK